MKEIAGLLQGLYESEKSFWCENFVAQKMLKKISITPGILFGYKALPSPSINDIPTPKCLEDWSAIYPQLTLEQSLAYLPNQWDRDHDEAHIVALYTKEDVEVIVYKDFAFQEPTISALEKANLVRSAIKESLMITIDGMLMSELGKRKYCLCALDADTFELIVPHELFTEEYFEVRPVIKAWQRRFETFRVESRVKFSSSDRMLINSPSALSNQLKKSEGIDDCVEMMQLMNLK
ncbi:hypothetical protein HK098_002270 [Nowakowskiella sp. JEL0407]|nr:hypothetical protein HK098_002270 [Nowakowskiella sp. JEL0407]